LGIRRGYLSPPDESGGYAQESPPGLYKRFDNA
jgi:hypothetical protein